MKTVESNSYSLEKSKKYKLIVELKELLKETVNLKGFDISIQASKVLAYIHQHSELKNYYDKQVTEYLNLKNLDTDSYYKNEQKEYDKFTNLAIQCNNTINLSKYFAAEKLFTKVIDYEFTNVMTHLLLNLSEDTLEKLKNECIYDGIFNYYSLIFHNVLNLKNRQPVILKLPKFSINVQTKSVEATLSNLQLLYDFYFLEFKEKQIITADNKYFSEWFYLKIAIIKVLNSLIEYLNCLTNIDNSSNKLTSADVEFLKLAIKTKVYEDETITTQDELINKMYPNSSANSENEKKKMRRICTHYKSLIPDERKKEKTLGKFMYIVQELQSKFT